MGAFPMWALFKLGMWGNSFTSINTSTDAQTYQVMDTKVHTSHIQLKGIPFQYLQIVSHALLLQVRFHNNPSMDHVYQLNAPG
ncbi:hypothetical protein KC19_3G001400 [Ceratodon purpureus]|uniref:Uncharacterized protein n=1 Tax=Ceratodon purpureus TaxID=3225 RepID=A0A8T0IFM8_CERPU|nr:hypothetical protein KC19_3G001400 [Ceratodon purpureus]